MASPQCGTPKVKLDKIKNCMPPMEQILEELDYYEGRFKRIYISSDKKIDKKMFENRGNGSHIILKDFISSDSDHDFQNCVRFGSWLTPFCESRSKRLSFFIL